jgi:hypothetical protein
MMGRLLRLRMRSFLNVLCQVLVLNDIDLSLIILSAFLSGIIANHGLVHLLGLHIIELVKELICSGFGLFLVGLLINVLFSHFLVLLMGELMVSVSLLNFSVMS